MCFITYAKFSCFERFGVVPGAVYVYEYSRDIWSFQMKLIPGDVVPGDKFGYSISASNSIVAIGAPWASDSSYLESGYKLTCGR